MADRVERILRLEVPIIVRLAERAMKLGDVMALVPGSIIELPKQAEEELDLLVKNKVIGTGSAVKVGENFGLQISYIGDLEKRVEAMRLNEGNGQGGAKTPEQTAEELAAEFLGEA